MPEFLVTALIVLVALWGVAVLLAGVWSLWADWSFERRDCPCRGSGRVLVEGPCDTAPLEAPCGCLARVIPFPSRERDLA